METQENSREPGFLQLAFEDLSGRNAIAEDYRADAATLAEVQGLDISLDEIIFVADRTGKAYMSPMAVMRIPELLSDVIFQISGRKFRFVIKIWPASPVLSGEAPFSAALQHILLFFYRNEAGRMELASKPEICEWRSLLPYVTEHGYSGVPNLLQTPLRNREGREEQNEQEAI